MSVLVVKTSVFVVTLHLHTGVAVEELTGEFIDESSLQTGRQTVLKGSLTTAKYGCCDLR